MNYVTSFIVGKDAGVGNTSSTLAGITKGDILIIDYNSNAVLTGASNTITTNPVIALAYCKTDGVPIISAPITGALLKSGAKVPYVAPAYTKKGFGYTSASTSLSLPSGLSTEAIFSGAVVFPTDLRLVPNRQDRIDFSVSSTGGYDLARKIMLDINRPTDTNPKITAPKPIVAYVATDIATSIATATATVVKGSTTVVFAAAVHGLSVGDYVKFPNGGTYRVATVVDTYTITLDSAYVGNNASIGAGLVVKGTPTKWGIEITSNPITYTNPVDQYNQVNFYIALGTEFKGLSEVSITAYKQGFGTGWQLRNAEDAAMGWTGYTDRRDTMRAPYNFRTDIAKTYLTVNMSWTNPLESSMEGTAYAPNNLVIAFDNYAATQSTAVMAILAPWALSGGVTLT